MPDQKREGATNLSRVALGGFVGIICNLPSSIHAANARFVPEEVKAASEREAKCS
jgi:hypothetical protein